ncbi:MAG: LacI family DNA-binding transcriptional regulator [Opitutaceae bacterium]|nr:LacI family DNA-binding transcriptional regulator [Opitutaceae bacterium]
MERCTLTQVAKAARLSVSTVSMALRNHPRIPEVTTQRVQRIARKLGYKAHPSVAALMAHIRSGRQPRSREKIAFVWIEAQPTELNVPFNRQTIAGARQRAEQLGYELEEFWLSEPGMTSRRLSDILKARGVTGVVFSGCDRQTGVQLEMDWGAHAAAVIGNAPWTPELHRAAHHHFLSMRRVLAELARREYHRPALILDELVNERAIRASEAAFVTHHPAPSRARQLLRKVAAADDPSLRSWLRQVRPDAVIVSRTRFLAALRSHAAALGKDTGYVTLELTAGENNISGIDPGHHLIGAHAVDLVIEQLFRNERGMPAEPKNVLFEGHWVEGNTLRAAPSVLVP